MAALDPAFGALDASREREAGPWRVETSAFALDWPANLALVSDEDPPGFTLVDSHEGMVFLQGPFPAPDVPEVDVLIAEGQDQVGSGAMPCPWVEVSYVQVGRGHVQRVLRAPCAEDVLVVTAQAPASHPDLQGLWRAASQIAASLSGEGAR